VRSPIETQPREMCFRGTKGQSTIVPGINKRDRSRPRQDHCNSAYEASAVQKQSPEANGQNCSIEPIYVEAGRAKLTILHIA
jgi:hypothetical protein